jgi:hypothetical protein
MVAKSATPSLDDAQRLGVVAAAGVVDDEAGRVLRLHRRVAHLAGVGGQVRADRGVGLQPGDHFHHLHQRHRIEEVVAGKALRPLQAAGDGRDRERGGVGGQHRVGRDDAFQLGEQALLDVQPFDDGFDHQLAAGQVAQAGGGPQAALAGLHGGRVHAALFLQLVPPPMRSM